MFLKSFVVASLALFAERASAAFGITTSSSAYVIDAGSSNPLKFTVSRTNCDITSINFYGSELQYQSTGSHIGSGLGSSATVTATESGDYIKVTCATSTLTHYYVVHKGDPIIHMATHTTAEPSVGELRYIARLNANLLPNEEPFGTVSNIGGGSVVEGEDVFLVDGQTRSKFYSSERFIDDKIHLTSTQTTLDLTPVYTGTCRSGTPSTNIDTSFFADLGITGYVATSGRGYVKGTASGADSSFKWVIHWYNSAAQYWTYASSGSFTSPAMKPGTYTMVYYQGEYPVATSSVTVTAGSTTSKSISGSVKTGTTIFRIGDWDKTPTGFRNAANQLRMHPSDSRMSSWSPGTYTVGSSSLTDFPMALFKSVNSPLTIKFTATSSQTGAATLRIGTTLSFAGGRPQATINSYTGSTPSAPTNLNSRGVTRGAYRGFGEVYDVSIPAGTIVAGTNTITISVVSGSSGTTYLSPNFFLQDLRCGGTFPVKVAL
ncbi:unnamed protein product [Penicillium salamii]|uniref:rhamnogalacturonan endolyase n=1 Tax=Penicillium salamii TaxID=1612424 RepID=A0A9W4JSY7_9EURO|nr:unnamed protein product [Penicillium salamii]